MLGHTADKTFSGFTAGPQQGEKRCLGAESHAQWANVGNHMLGVEAMPETAQSLIAFCRGNKRVCPMPQSWNALFEMLPNRKRTVLGWEPPLPLILEAWDNTPGALKTLRLAEHIEWAAEQGALDAIASFLRALPEDAWLHAS